MAIDVLYTFAAILKEPLSIYKNDILEVMTMLRTDKVKPVREAAIEAIQMLREVPDTNKP
jgi:hypothetical protein